MRTQPLFIDDLSNKLVAGLNSASEARFEPFTIRDEVQFVARRVVPLAQRGANIYGEIPWGSETMRLSVGLIAAAPTSGSFILRVGGQNSEAIVWPAVLAGQTALTDAQITAFKADALAKLKAIAGVGANAVVASDPPNTPITHLYFTWTDDADERVIEVLASGNKLAPITLPVVAVQKPKPGFQQCVILQQASVKQGVNFELGGAVSLVFVEQHAGQAGQNAVQRLTIPSGARGTLALKFSGASTRQMAFPGITAEQLTTALNALVTGDADNPSFNVVLVGGTRSTFDVEFIGPRAETTQALLTASFLSATPPTVATASIDFTDPRFRAILNGAKSATLQLELVLTDADGKESSIKRDIVLEADLSQGGDVAQLEELGAVITNTVTVNVPVGSAAPVATVSAGSSFGTGALTPATTYNFEHGLGSEHVFIRVSHRDSDDPEKWSDLEAPLFDWQSNGEDFAIVTFAQPLDDEESFWFREKFKVFIYSPDSIVQLLEHIHAIADITGLQAALDALAAAIGMVEGELKIQVSNLVGKITVENIDLKSFLTEMFELIQSDATLSQTFTNLLTQSLVNNATFVSNLANAAKTNPDWNAVLREMVLSILQSLGGTGAVLSIGQIPDVTFVYPRAHLLATAPGRAITPVVIEDTSTSGLKKTYTRLEEIETTRQILDYAPLSPALGDLPAGNALTGTITLDTDSTVTLGPFTADGSANTLTINTGVHGLIAGCRVRVPVNLGGLVAGTDYFVLGSGSGLTTTALKLSLTPGGSPVDITGTDATHTLIHYLADSGQKFQVATGASIGIAAVDGIDTVDVSAGSFVGYGNGHWFVLELVGAVNYPAAYRVELGKAAMSADALTEGKRWNIVFGPGFALASPDNKAVARGRLAIQTAPADATTTLDALTWTTRLDLVVRVVAGAARAAGFVQIDCTAANTYTARAALGGAEATWTPADADLLVRYIFDRFDPATPEGDDYLGGSLTVSSLGATHSLLAIEDES